MIRAFKWVERFDLWLSRHWLALFNTFVGVFVVTPYLAPVLMRLGLTDIADRIYSFYMLIGHQLPQRSIFLFGPKLMISLPEITAITQSFDLVVLKRFVGNAEIGWKVAYSDRLMAWYGTFWIASLVFAVIRRRVKPLPFGRLILLALPMLIDGATHLISDVLVNQQFGAGFRDTNLWLAQLTNNALSPSFRAGDLLGSFNSLARWISGAVFGVGLAWFLLPVAHGVFTFRLAELESVKGVSRG
ncbi:hypothetical protein TFLX_05798 [Thermoflexales bacterium]|nr:hypothetical protein TFLX_05798 [Thermoflexales bacterium]